jgi:SAM-dependent methyltransferase
MMFGFRDVFPYIECSSCGCLQIQEYPSEISKYYPDDYYSYKNIILPADSSFRRWMLHSWVKYALTGEGTLGMLIAAIKPVPALYRELKKYKVTFDSRILDVGCGSGQFLITMYRAGFRNLLGIDPFLPEDVDYSAGLQIKKMRLQELNGEFDLITLNHSFEHMKEPLAVMDKLYSLLSDKGVLIIRIPVLGFAWRHYGVNWIQMDPPRHYFLHTLKSIGIIARQAGFVLADTVCDSNEFQFCGSEQYSRDIPFLDAEACCKPNNLVLTENDVRRFRIKAEQLNSSMDGDQASFYFVKRDESTK